MKVIGLTGGIASGKSTVTEYLKSRGIFVIDCDKESRALLMKGEECYDRIVEEFGNDIVAEDCQIDRKKLAEKVFGTEGNVKKLNAIVHPLVRKRAEELIEAYRVLGERWILLDAPLLLEARMNEICDEIWVIYIPEELQIQRAMARDNSTREQVIARMKKQMPSDEKLTYADRIILNDGTQQDLYNKIDEMIGLVGK